MHDIYECRLDVHASNDCVWCTAFGLPLFAAGWFTGLSQHFLSCPVPKLLILAGLYCIYSMCIYNMQRCALCSVNVGGSAVWRVSVTCSYERMSVCVCCFSLEYRSLTLPLLV